MFLHLVGALLEHFHKGMAPLRHKGIGQLTQMRRVTKQKNQNLYIFSSDYSHHFRAGTDNS